MFTELPELLTKTLTDERFELVDKVEDADVCWAVGFNRAAHIKQAQQLDIFVN